MGSWWGKIIGGGLGYLIGGPLGGLIGAGLGHLIDEDSDNSNAYQKNQQNNSGYYYDNNHEYGDYNDSYSREYSGEDKLSDDEIQVVGLTLIVALMAKIAKADGVVTKDEANLVKTILLNDFNLDNETFEYVKGVFNEAKNSPYGYDEYAEQFRNIVGDNYDILHDVLAYLFVIAAADNYLSPEEEEMLRKVSNIFGISQEYFEGLKKKFFGESLEKYYKILGCPDSSVSLDQLKKCYHDKVRKYHPDVLEGKDIPDEIIRLAEEKFKEIQEAWEKVSTSRGV